MLVRWDMDHNVDGEEDLNKLDDEELRKKKLAMEETFDRNKILPGHPDYVYDKEVGHFTFFVVLRVGKNFLKETWNNKQVYKIISSSMNCLNFCCIAF